jgi:hypothetical protein
MQPTLQPLGETRQHPASEDMGCEGCHERRFRRGKRNKRMVTLRGEVAVERPYSVCPNWGAGRFPQDEPGCLNATVSSDALAKPRVGLSGWLPDAPGQAVFEPMGERLIRASSSWRPSNGMGSAGKPLSNPTPTRERGAGGAARCALRPSPA